MAFKHCGPTTCLAKRGQIVGLANHNGNQRLSLKEIAAIMKISLSTCSDISPLSVLHLSENHRPSVARARCPQRGVALIVQGGLLLCYGVANMVGFRVN